VSLGIPATCQPTTQSYRVPFPPVGMLVTYGQSTEAQDRVARVPVGERGRVASLDGFRSTHVRGVSRSRNAVTKLPAEPAGLTAASHTFNILAQTTVTPSVNMACTAKVSIRY